MHTTSSRKQDDHPAGSPIGWLASWAAVTTAAGAVGGLVAAAVGRAVGLFCLDGEPALCEGSDSLVPFLVGSTAVAALGSVGYLAATATNHGRADRRAVTLGALLVGGAYGLILVALAALSAVPTAETVPLLTLVAASALLASTRPAISVAVLAAQTIALALLLRTEVVAALALPAWACWLSAAAVNLMPSSAVRPADARAPHASP